MNPLSLLAFPLSNFPFRSVLLVSTSFPLFKRSNSIRFCIDLLTSPLIRIYKHALIIQFHGIYQTIVPYTGNEFVRHVFKSIRSVGLWTGRWLEMVVRGSPFVGW